MMDATEIRRRINASLDIKRERLDQIEDSALLVLVDYLRGLYPSQRFDPVDFLADWLFGPIPVLGGLTPAEVLKRERGLERLKEILGQQAAGVAV